MDSKDQKLYRIEYRKKNRDKINAYQREYKKRNPGNQSLYNKKYRKANANAIDMYQTLKYIAFKNVKAKAKASAKRIYYSNRTKRMRQMKDQYYQNQLAHAMYQNLILVTGLGRPQRKRRLKEYRAKMGHALPMYKQLMKLFEKDVSNG